MPIVEFAPFRLDLVDERLWRGHEVVPLTPKAFAVLRCLVDHPGQLVTKDTLLDTVWPETAISESTLTGCIWEVRQALGDAARAPHYIETVHGRGYRFIASLRSVDPPRTQHQSALPPLQSPAILRVPAPLFVGRAQERQQLFQWYTTARHGRRQVGFISGEAGIGKTALVDAFLADVITAQPVWVGHGQCIEQYGAGEPYLPLLESLSRLCREADGERLIAILRQYAPSWLGPIAGMLTPGERRELQPRHGRATPERMLRELAEAIEIITADRPLILVLEDLHWSDHSTLEWLAYVARRRDLARFLVLATYRPVDAIVRRHRVRTLTTELKQRQHGVELALDYLSANDVAAYIVQRCGATSFPEGLAHALHQRTSGNPLFVVTVVEELMRQRTVTQEAEAWQSGDEVNVLAGWVPATLRELIELQLEDLDPSDQLLLEAASVAGVEFAVVALAASLECPESEVEARCAALAHRGQFLQVRAPVQWPDGTLTARYGFRHVFYHEVLYHRLPAGRQSGYHARIGTRLARGLGQDTAPIAAELATHFVRGHQAGQAVDFLWQAGLQAEHRGAYQEAIHHLTLAMDQLATLPATPERDRRELDVQLALARTLRLVKGFASTDVQHVLTRARELCQHIGERSQLGRVVFGLWNFHLVRGDLHTAYELAGQLQALHPFRPSRNLGYTLFFRGEFPTSWDILKRMMPDKDAQPPLPGSNGNATNARWRSYSNVILHGYASVTLLLLGYLDQAMQTSRASLDLAEAFPPPHPLSHALHWAILVQQLRRAPPRVRELSQTLVSICREGGDAQHQAQGTITGGWALAAEGQEVAGLRQMHQGLTSWRGTGARLYLPYYLSLLADAYGMLGDIEQGLRVLDEACAFMDTSGIHWSAAHLYHTRGTLLLFAHGNTGDTEKPETCFQQAIDVARQQHAKLLELRATVSLCRLWQQQGTHDEARALLTPIYTWFTEGFDTADLMEARALLDELSEDR